MKKLILALAFAACTSTIYAQSGAPVHHAADSIFFAVIGDYGDGSPHEMQVAEMVGKWNPNFIITTGDNNYPIGDWSTLMPHIGKPYENFIYNPDAPDSLRCHGTATTAQTNRFFPATGNHDHYNDGSSLTPYLAFFSLPGNEQNYEFSWGPVHFFSINTGAHGEPTVGMDSCKHWLQTGLAAAKEPFKVVYFHHPPYSTGEHGSSPQLRWPFKEWGADIVFNGHDHFFESFIPTSNNDIPYVICGNSGNDRLYNKHFHKVDKHLFHITADNRAWGALKVYATPHQFKVEYYRTDKPEAQPGGVLLQK